MILFIHGAPGTWDAYKNYLADYELQQQARLISMDRLGYGSSNLGIPELDIKNHAAAAKTILDRYTPSKIIVVGHSYGGPIAAMLAANYNNIIDGVLMVAPLNDPENEPVKWYAKLCNSPLLNWALPYFITISTAEKMGHSQSLKNIKPQWQNIKTPIIHYHGKKDALAPFEANINFSKTNIPQQWLTIKTDKEDGHLVIFDEGAKMTRLILSLLEM